MTFRIFILWIFVLIGRPQDLIPELGQVRPAVILSLATLISLVLSGEVSKNNSSIVMKSTLAKRYLLFFIVMVVGIPFAYHRRIAFEQVFLSYLVNMLFFFVFVLLVNSIERLKAAILAILFATFIYGIFTLIKGSFITGRFVTYGKMFDPNDIAYVLVSMFPIGLFYLAHKEGILKKIMAIITMASSVAVILLTGSRGGAVSLLFVAILILLINTGSIKRSQIVIFLAVMVVAAFYFRDKINFERYLTITSLGEDYNVTSETGRKQIWGRAFQLLLDNPLTGVGAGCFGMAIGYLRKDLDLIPEWQASHNSYLQIAAETGIIGFSFFASLIFRSFKSFSNLRKIDIQSPEASQFKTLSGLLMVGFTGHLIAAFFLSQGYSIFFTLFFALSATLNRIARPTHVKENVYTI